MDGKNTKVKGCSDCGKSALLFKCNDKQYRCYHCCHDYREFIKGNEAAENGMEKEYVVKWKLRDESGKEWIEEMEHMTLSDFEVAYGNISHQILWLIVRKKNHALI